MRGGRGRGGDRKADINKRPGGPRGGPEQAQNHSSDVYRLDQFTLDNQQSVQVRSSIDFSEGSSNSPKYQDMTWAENIVMYDED